MFLAPKQLPHFERSPPFVLRGFKEQTCLCCVETWTLTWIAKSISGSPMEQPLYNEYAAQLADQQYRQLNAQYETEVGGGGLWFILGNFLLYFNPVYVFSSWHYFWGARLSKSLIIFKLFVVWKFVPTIVFSAQTAGLSWGCKGQKRTVSIFGVCCFPVNLHKLFVNRTVW